MSSWSWALTVFHFVVGAKQSLDRRYTAGSDLVNKYTVYEKVDEGKKAVWTVAAAAGSDFGRSRKDSESVATRFKASISKLKIKNSFALPVYKFLNF